MSCAACGTENPAGARFCMSCGAQLRAPLPQLRHARAARGALLHELRAPRSTRAPARRRPRRRAGPPARGAPPGDGPVRRPVRLHRRRRAHGPGGREGARRPRAAAPRRGGRALRRHRRQVHRRQRDGDLRRAGGPRGRRGARGPRRRSACRRRWTRSTRTCPTASTSTLRVGVNTGEVLAGAVGEDYTVIGRHRQRRRPAPERGPPRQRDRGRAHHARHRAARSATSSSSRSSSRASPSRSPPGRPSSVRAPAGRRPRAPPSARRRWWAATTSWSTLESVFERVERERRAPPGHAGRRGRRGQVAPAARARAPARRAARSPRPSAPGRCLPYGTGIVFWALGEVLRAECGIVDADSAEEAWGKLRDYACRPVRQARTRPWARRPSARRR